MLSRFCLLAFAPCLRAQERGPYPHPPSDLSHAKATYESLMLRWARASSSIHRCLEAVSYTHLTLPTILLV